MTKKESKSIHQLFQKLLKAKQTSFPPKYQRLQAPTEHGIYIIYDPTGRVVHVGRSLRRHDGLFGRLSDHLQTKSSFTKEYMKGKGSKLRDGYKFKYLAIPDPRKRALVEHLATGTLCPLHLGLGIKK